MQRILPAPVVHGRVATEPQTTRAIQPLPRPLGVGRGAYGMISRPLAHDRGTTEAALTMAAVVSFSARLEERSCGLFGLHAFMWPRRQLI